MKKVYLFGTFDVANYGDLLFPPLVRKRLAAVGIEMAAFSPLGGPPIWPDCLPAGEISRLKEIEPPSVILIGGGNIIQLLPSNLQSYDYGLTPLVGYPDLWIGASLLAASGTRVCWNAPGVPGPFPKTMYPLVRDCLNRADYLSVRDENSRTFLQEVCPEADIAVCPDPAWEISMLWSELELADAREKAFTFRWKVLPERTATVHLNSRYLASASDEELGRELDLLSNQLDARIILTAIGPCHGDDQLARRVGAVMKSEPLIVDAPQGLREIAACIAGSVFYAGSSMHGLITAAAFDVPCVCVMPVGQKPKFEGLKNWLYNEDFWVRSWKEAAPLAGAMNFEQKRQQLSELNKRIRRELDGHWDTLLNIIQSDHESGNRSVDNRDQTKISSRLLEYRSNLVSCQAVEQSKKDLLGRLSDREREIQKYRDELYSVYSSRSWRYTSGLRKIGSRLRLLKSIFYWFGLRQRIKFLYLLIPQRIRCSWAVEGLKNQYKERVEKYWREKIKLK